MRTSRRYVVLVVVALLVSAVSAMGARATGLRAAKPTVYTYIEAVPLRPNGTPYGWEVDVTQLRDANGTTTPYISETATRTAPSGASVSHTWTFNLAPTDIDIHVQPDLRNTSVVYTAMPGYMNLDMHATDLSPLKERVTRCKATGDITKRTRTRTGVLRGTFTFYPNLAIPEFPGQVHATRMKVTLTRIILYPVSCPAGTPCSGTDLNASRSGAPNPQLAVYDRGGPARITASYYTSGSGLVFSHAARAAKDGVIEIGPDAVIVRGKPLAPFGDRTKLVFDKGARTTDTSDGCRTTAWELTVASGKLVVDFDTDAMTFDTFDTAALTIATSV